jgi:hypothetical protein
VFSRVTDVVCIGEFTSCAGSNVAAVRATRAGTVLSDMPDRHMPWPTKLGVGCVADMLTWSWNTESRDITSLKQAEVP